MAQIGDIVRYLNAVGGGRIARIEGQIAYVDEEDGFQTPVLVRECVVVTPATPPGSAPRKAASSSSQKADEPRWWEEHLKPKKDKPRKDSAPVSDYDEKTGASAQSSAKAQSTPSTPATKSAAPQPVLAPDDTPEGEKLNIVLAFEALDIKQLSSTDFEAVLVNDSNYSLFVTYMTRADGDEGWTLRFAETVEPHMQVPVQQIARADIREMDRVALQYVAYKEGRRFALKAPVAVEHKLDTTKFFKLHCFRANEYFDSPVIAIDITRNDTPRRQVILDSGRIEEGMQSKLRADNRREVKSESKSSKPSANEPIVVDLHIDELLDTTAGLDNADMLRVQLDEFNRVMQEHARDHGRRIVFIHGKGEGVLRKALLKELNYKYKSADVQDASFREYGFGATQVTIK